MGLIKTDSAIAFAAGFAVTALLIAAEFVPALSFLS